MVFNEKGFHVKIHAASLKTQRKWIPKGFQIDDEFGCLTCSESLNEISNKLKLVYGITRFPNGKWGDHAWNITPQGSIIDPYYMEKFPDTWMDIEYKESSKAFDGQYAEE